MKRIYLAGPYTHHDRDVRARRERALSEKCADLMLSGYVVFSPITHGHALATFLPSAKVASWVFWGAQDKSHLLSCDELHVLMLDGWDSSRGVGEEIEWATEAGMSIIYHQAAG